MFARSTALHRHRLLLSAVLLAAIAGCGATAPDSRQTALLDLARHRSQWESKSIHDYEFAYGKNAFGRTTVVQILVLHDTVTAVTDKASGATIAASASYPTIEALFTMAAQALGDVRVDAHVTYDAQYGFPSLIDAPASTPAGGYTATVSDFGLLFTLQ